jgi:hypothetical protein
MNVTWGRVLAGSVVVVILLALGSLEVFSGRVRVDQSSPTVPTPGDDRTAPRQDFLIQQGDLLNLELGPPADWEAGPGIPQNLTKAVQTGRLTVLEVDKEAQRLVSVNGLGRVRVAEVSNEAVVVTEDKKAADLASLTVGDLIRVEPSDGRIQRIVVLRHAWHETGSPEQ